MKMKPMKATRRPPPEKQSSWKGQNTKSPRLPPLPPVPWINTTSRMTSLSTNITIDEQSKEKAPEDNSKKAQRRRKRKFPFDPKKFAFKFTPRRRKGRQGKKTLMITSCPRDSVRYIHPGYRHLVPWCKHFQGIVVKRKLATRIRNRTVYYFPFPRVFPYFCDNCQTNTPSLEVIQNHNCVRRRPRDFDPENEQKIITLGYRSRAKDRLAVMERLPNPQHYQVISYHFHNDDDPVMRWRHIPTLAELCLEQSLNLSRAEVEEAPPDVTSVKCEKLSEHCMCLTCGLEFQTSSEYFEHLSLEPECLENRQNPLLLAQC